MKITEKRKFGNEAEIIAEHYLKNKGYEIKERNYQRKWGEIDIIATKNSVIIFVEVKANAKDFGSEFDPSVRVDRRKMSALMKTAILYMQYEAKNLDCEWRIDIISVIIKEGKASIKHFKNIAEDYS